MRLGTSPRAWYGAFSWHLRGLFATEGLRRIEFGARELWQPAEVEARRGLARDICTDLVPELRLKRDAGYWPMSPGTIPDVSEVCQIGQRILRESSREKTGETPGEKPFFRFRMASVEERLTLLRLALDHRLLAMAAAYFGVMPVISEADYFCSFPVHGPYTKSQLWHCDDDASDVLKLFIYCGGVTDADGPFQLIEPTASHRVRDAIGYRYAGRRYRVSDDLMERFVPEERLRSVIGPAGTSFVVDTVRCFHRGSRIREKDRRRVMAMICYAPPNGRTLPRRLRRDQAPLASFIPSFAGKLEQAALGQALAAKWL